MAKSLINRRAAKAADSMWRKPGLFTRLPRTTARDREIRQKPVAAAEKSAALRQTDGECPEYIQETGSPYPLCDNPECPYMRTCDMSMYTPGTHNEDIWRLAI